VWRKLTKQPISMWMTVINTSKIRKQREREREREREE